MADDVLGGPSAASSADTAIVVNERQAEYNIGAQHIPDVGPQAWESGGGSGSELLEQAPFDGAGLVSGGTDACGVPEHVHVAWHRH